MWCSLPKNSVGHSIMMMMMMIVVVVVPHEYVLFSFSFDFSGTTRVKEESKTKFKRLLFRDNEPSTFNSGGANDLEL